MDKKKLMFFLVLVLLLTGCTRITDDLDSVINAVMMVDNTSLNTVSTGYELYIPIGVTQIVDNDYNHKFKISNTHVYLYVDTVSYYHEYELNYNGKDNYYNYYYKSINLNDKVGYIGINKQEDDSYFVEIVYNYSKIEFYSNYEDMPIIISNSLMILNSIKYNYNLIELQLNNMANDSRELKYELDKPEDSVSTFSQVLQEYVEPEETDVVLPDSE